MNIFKKLSILCIFILIFNILPFSYSDALCIINVEKNVPARIGVIFYDETDAYLNSVEQYLKQIENSNPEQVKFSFYDSKKDKELQLKQMNYLIDNKLIDVLSINLINLTNEYVEKVIDKCKEKNIPVILFNDKPNTMDAVQSYGKAIVIATDSVQSGKLQGELIYNLLKDGEINLSADKILSYIMLEGKIDSESALDRTYYSISTLNSLGVKTNELALIPCQWNRECAKTEVESIFIRYGDTIELIISNNDAMALGAIDALQKYGYNLKGGTKKIPVVGIDAIEEAQQAIKNGIMSGTVLQKPEDTANAIYSIGLNLFYNKPPLDNTIYKYSEPNLIRLPYYKYEPWIQHLY